MQVRVVTGQAQALHKVAVGSSYGRLRVARRYSRPVGLRFLLLGGRSALLKKLQLGGSVNVSASGARGLRFELNPSSS